MVALDGNLWPEEDHLPRPVQHGSYAQVIVPPPPTHSVPTQDAVVVAQHTADNTEDFEAFLAPSSTEDDAVMEEEADEADTDGVQLTQLAAQYRTHSFIVASLPRDADRQPACLGAVLQHPAELNPQTKATCEASTNESNHSLWETPSAGTHSKYDTEDVANRSQEVQPVSHLSGSTVPTPQAAEPRLTPEKDSSIAIPALSIPCKQTKISSFFGKAVNHSEVQPKQKQTKQTTICQFFAAKSQDETPVPSADDPVKALPGPDTYDTGPVESASTASATPAMDQPMQARTGIYHEAEPPSFEARIPTQHMNPNVPRPRPLWHIELNAIFLDEATTYHHETGPEMSVEVWYVHHVHMPICRAPRLIRLDDIRDLWYADLCNSWFDQIRRHQPVRVHIVKPTPPYQMRRQAVVHIILEQGMVPEKAAILFTAAFHGGTRMGLLQQAESSPVDICTDQVIRDHELQPQCNFRPCHLFSGRYRFHPSNRERVPSGISVLLDVGDHRLQTRAQSSIAAPMQVDTHGVQGAEVSDDRSDMSNTSTLMQRPRFKAFPKPAARACPVTSRAPEMTTWFTIYQPLSQVGADQHQPVQGAPVQVRNLQDFHSVLQWQANRARDDCFQQDTNRAKIATWYLEPNVLPRSDHHREVLLSGHPNQWPSDILQRWADFLQPNRPVDLYVVQPDPPGGLPDIVAHVLVVQNAHSQQAAALISVTELIEDPWHPSRFVLFLNGQVTCEELFEHASIPHEQVAATPGIGAYHGTTNIPQGSSYPVHHGFAFEVVTDSLDFEGEDQVMLQLPPRLPSRSLTYGEQEAMPTAATATECRQRAFHAMQQICDAIASMVAVLDQSRTDLPTCPVTQDHNHTVMPRWQPPVDSNFTGKRSLDQHEHAAPSTSHRWQQLAAIRPKEARPMAPVMTWYVDHERFPQCFAPREVFVTRNPADWRQVILRAWNDVYLPTQTVDVVIVQPDPVMMEDHIAAHVMVLQQQAQGFTTALLTTIDSAVPDMRRRHATIVPDVISRAMLLALAFHPQDCEQSSNTCDAWVGDDALEEREHIQLSVGQSCTAVIHRHPVPTAEQPDPWESKLPRPCKHRVPICLQAVLPQQSYQVPVDIDDDKPQILWFANEAWKFALEEEEPLPLLPLPEGMTIPDPAYWPLLQPPPTSALDEISYTLYLDGAANGLDAGWSVIVVACHPEGESFIGCLLGTVQLGSEHPNWFGADTADNISAELTAMVTAQNFAMRWKGHHGFCIRPELSLSRTVATAATTCRSNQSLAKLCGALGPWLGNKVTIQEVRGHKGHAWNELADAVAKWTMQNHCDPLLQQFTQLHELATNPHDVDWIWMQTTHPALSACFPPLTQQQIMQFTKPCLKLGVIPTERKTATHQDAATEWRLTVCTANVLASEVWAHHTAGTKRTGQRTVRLDQQWHRAQIHAIGIQEARTPQGRFHAPHYHIFASGARHKRAPLLGCELWIHKTLPVAKDLHGNPIVLGKATFITQHADPRRLFIEARLGHTVYAFVVLHAPSLAPGSQGAQDPAELAKQWWIETTALYTKHVTATAQWVFVDANAPLDAGEGPLIGPHGAEPANRASELFEEFIQTHQLTVPCTFPQIHEGPTTTWTHTTGKRSRKDYVLLSQGVATLAYKSWIDIHHDTTFAHKDHLPAVLQCSGWLHTSNVNPPITWDEPAMLDPQKVADFQAALHTLPLPQWQVGVDDHAALYEQQVLALGRQFFAKKPRKARPISLHPQTLDAIAFKRHVLDFGRKAGCIHQADFKLELRAIEKDVARKVSFDIRAFYDDLLQQIQTSGEISNHRLVFRLLHRLGRKKGASAMGPRPLPMIHKPDGTTASSYIEQQRTWMHQFAHIEAGIPRTWEELEHQHESQTPDMPCHDL